MSQENVEIMRRAYAAFNRGDIDDLLALMDEDVEAVSRLAAWRCVKGRRPLCRSGLSSRSSASTLATGVGRLSCDRDE